MLRVEARDLVLVSQGAKYLGDNVMLPVIVPSLSVALAAQIA
jgi:hypothetical protein